jgi:DNA-binding response OmpR family regulator
MKRIPPASLDNSHERSGTAVAVPGPQVHHKVLIVDDNEAARTGLAKILERADFTVFSAATFAEGRSALTKEQPDLLIADVRLGEYNGLQLLAGAARPMPAIIVTGYPDPVLEADARRMGAEYLVKPISPTALVELVRQKLTTPQEQIFRPARKWERKQISGSLPARVGDEPARILDISYGGLRLELGRKPERPVPTSFTLDFPASGVSVPVDVVWTTRVGEEHWVCGASVVQAEDAAARAWQGLVDAVA